MRVLLSVFLFIIQSISESHTTTSQASKHGIYNDIKICLEEIWCEGVNSTGLQWGVMIGEELSCSTEGISCYNYCDSGIVHSLCLHNCILLAMLVCVSYLFLYFTK
jgi:hypothetical protein